MIRLWPVYALARADFFERTRRYQYIATIVVTIVLGTLLLPPKSAGYTTFLVDGYRGIYNSAWIGATLGVIGAMLISLFGFYNIKSAVEIDRKTRIGEIVGSTTIGRFEYCLGKSLSNFAVLSSTIVALLFVAIAMQLVRGESAAIEVGQIAMPFALILFPVAAVVSATAVLFEMIPWLRGGFGNVVYFFAWISYLVSGDPGKSFQHQRWWTDLMGIGLVSKQILSGLRSIDPRATLDAIDIGTTTSQHVRFFTFQSPPWAAGDLVQRVVWLGVALAIVALASAIFDRFASGARSAGARPPGSRAVAWRVRVEGFTTPLLDLLFGSDFGAIVLAELRLLLNGMSFWWYAVAAGLGIACLAANAQAQSIVLGLAWIWPMLQWSQLGTREAAYDTEQFVYPTLHPIRRQLVAQWIAGILLALLAGSGSLLHWIAAGSAPGVSGVVVGAIFIPTLALACGALSGTTRLFEIVYLVLWYVGPMNRTPFDFTQGTNAPAFALASCLLFGTAVGARYVRLQRA